MASRSRTATSRSVDETVPRRVEVTGLNLTTGEIAPGEPFTDSRDRGRVAHGRVRACGCAVPARPSRKPWCPRTIRASTRGNSSWRSAASKREGGVSGTLGEKPRFSGAIETNEFDPRALLTAVGIEAPKTTDPGAFGKVRFKGAWAFDGGAIGIDPLALTLDDTHFTGDFLRGAGEDPVGEFTLRGDALNISRYIPPADPDSEPFVLPTATLKNLKFRGVLELEQATLDDIVMKGVTLRLCSTSRDCAALAKPLVAAP